MRNTYETLDTDEHLLELNYFFISYRAVSFHLRSLGLVPQPNEEYFFFQTLIGAWPIAATAASEEFVRRVTDYMMKVREKELI